MIVTLVKKKESIRLIAGMEYFYPDPKTFANVKFSICTGKERVFSAKGCGLLKQADNLTFAQSLGPGKSTPFQRSRSRQRGGGGGVYSYS